MPVLNMPCVSVRWLFQKKMDGLVVIGIENAIVRIVVV